MLNSTEQRKYEIISKIVNGEITRKEAVFELNKSRQQIYRLIQIYKKKENKDLFIKIEVKNLKRKLIEV